MWNSKRRNNRIGAKSPLLKVDADICSPPLRAQPELQSLALEEVV